MRRADVKNVLELCVIECIAHNPVGLWIQPLWIVHSCIVCVFLCNDPLPHAKSIVVSECDDPLPYSKWIILHVSQRELTVTME